MIPINKPSILDHRHFLHPAEAGQEWLVGVTDYIDRQWLLLAYRFGIFPMYNQNEPVQWWYPDVRWVLPAGQVKISKSMRKLLRERNWKVTMDTAFEEVIRSCGDDNVRKYSGTWIDEHIIEAYLDFHLLGRAHSVEVWDQNNLIGGLYGVQTGKVFTGESMFSRVSNASKYGFIFCCLFIESLDIPLIDCQMYSSHLESLGAISVDGQEYLNYLKSVGFQNPSDNRTWTEDFERFMGMK